METIIFPCRKPEGSGNPVNWSVFGWWNSPPLTAEGGKHSQAGRSLKEKQDLCLHTTSNMCYSQDVRHILQIPNKKRDTIIILCSKLIKPLPWLWGSKDSHAYLSSVCACSGNNFWGGGCTEKHQGWCSKHFNIFSIQTSGYIFTFFLFSLFCFLMHLAAILCEHIQLIYSIWSNINIIYSYMHHLY